MPKFFFLNFFFLTFDENDEIFLKFCAKNSFLNEIEKNAEMTLNKLILKDKYKKRLSYDILH